MCHSIVSVLCFVFLATRHVGSQLPNQGWNRHPPHWKGSLKHWATKEVPQYLDLVHYLAPTHTHPICFSVSRPILHCVCIRGTYACPDIVSALFPAASCSQPGVSFTWMRNGAIREEEQRGRVCAMGSGEQRSREQLTCFPVLCRGVAVAKLSGQARATWIWFQYELSCSLTCDLGQTSDWV